MAVMVAIMMTDTADPRGASFWRPNRIWMELPIMVPPEPPTSAGVT